MAERRATARSRRIVRLAAAAFGLCLLGPPAGAADGLTVDIAVTLKKADVVLNMDHVALDGDMPFGLEYASRMVEVFRKQGTEWRVVLIFHGPAGYMMLADATYDRVRKTATGNPYRAVVARLQKEGVTFEECGETAAEAGWTNADMLPGVAVNSGANFRIVELVQQGFVQIQP
jgi:intracellular sulfur oxidation DsrE/DsrF family protein